jgi:AcrR family transcriptional regulator
MSGVEISRRERKKDETRERISQAAIQLFHEKGFEATTVDEIAARADVAKGTFFNYFPRKEAVLHAITERQIDALEALADRLASDPRGVKEKLLAVFEEACSLYAANADLHRHAIVQMMRGPLANAVEIDARAQTFVRGLVTAGQERGELRADVDPDRMAYTLRSVFFMTVLVWVHCPEMFELKTEMAARLQLVFEGLATGGAR